ncbi:MAG: hypothetical protein IPQ13_06860 [Holophagaceae bacterium]|nr:hypothetical protein [Holophagaceae bacterium]
MYRLDEIFDATTGERMMADLNEDRAHMIRPKYQLTTDASETPDDVGHDVTAEIGKIKGAAFEIWTLPTA